MNITLRLSKGDLADLQAILADEIVRLGKKRNSGRVTPGAVFCLYWQQQLLLKVNAQLHAAATKSCPQIPRRANRKEAS